MPEPRRPKYDETLGWEVPEPENWTSKHNKISRISDVKYDAAFSTATLTTGRHIVSFFVHKSKEALYLYLGVCCAEAARMNPAIEPPSDPNKTKPEEIIGWGLNCNWGCLMTFKSPHHVYWSGSMHKLTADGEGLREAAKGARVSMLVDMDKRSLAFKVHTSKAEGPWIDTGASLPAAVKPWVLTGEKDSVSLTIQPAADGIEVQPVPPPKERGVQVEVPRRADGSIDVEKFKVCGMKILSADEIPAKIREQFRERGMVFEGDTPLDESEARDDRGGEDHGETG